MLDDGIIQQIHVCYYLNIILLYLGAFNLSIALATQQSKAAKEQLQVARAEQKDLLEDLCDIEDELDIKLGIFRVHINGNNRCYK